MISEEKIRFISEYFAQLRVEVPNLERFDYLNKIWNDTYQNNKHISFVEAVILANQAVLNKILDDPKDFCQCIEPCREPGFDYCDICHKHVSLKRLNELTDKSEE